jgi:FixJ family two-component response regulator
MRESDPVVYVVDDDQSVRDGIKSLIAAAGMQVEAFESACAFRHSRRTDAPTCLVLDVRLPDSSGLDFQRELAETGAPIPIIFITGYGDVPTSVRAMKAGAVEFLTKPFRSQDLLGAVQEALARDCEVRRQRAAAAGLCERYNSLTPREKEVMALVVAGLLNKQIAADLDRSELTVKTHRAQVMRKMRAESLAELVRMSERLKALTPEQVPSPAKAG